MGSYGKFGLDGWIAIGEASDCVPDMQFANTSAFTDLWPRPDKYYKPQINIANPPGIEIKIAKEAPGIYIYIYIYIL